MPRRKIDAHPAARRELLDEVAKIDADRPGWGKKLRQAYERKLAQIRRFPQSGTDIVMPGGHDVQRFGIRKFDFSIIVLTRDGKLTILAFAAKGRKPGYWKKRLKKEP